MNDGAGIVAILLGASIAAALTTAVLSRMEPPRPYYEGLREPTRAPVGWTDPRGPDRGPSALEWEVISTYETIETMTATTPSIARVDAALARLQAYAGAHPENPYVQELSLKALRVAAWYAVDGGDPGRALALRAAFDARAPYFLHYQGVAQELERFEEQEARLGL